VTIDEAVREKHLLDLFIHPGWKLLLEEMQEAHQVLVETAYTVKTEQELYKRKGEIQKLGDLLNYEQVFRLQLTANDETGLYE
jgi:hypothetical protein